MSGLLLAVLLFPSLSEDVRKELSGVDAAAQVRILEDLPARMAEQPESERRALAPLLRGILRDPGRVRLHPSTLAPLVATGTVEGVRDVLGLVLGREETALRESARSALVRDRGTATSGHLAALLGADRSARARAIIALLLGERGELAVPAAEILVTALSDPEPMVRGAAAEALTRIYRECRGFDPAAWRERVRAGPPSGGGGETPAAGAGVAPPTVAGPASPERALSDLNPQLFGIPLDRPVVVAVLDFSRSMRGSEGDAARAALVTALSLLPSGRRFTLLAFDERLLVLSPTPEAAGADLKERLLDFVKRLPPGRRTELLSPLRTAIELARVGAGMGGSQVIVLSDGQPTLDGPPLDDLLDRAEGLREAGVRIDAVLLGGREAGLLRYLASATGGRIEAR
ncbi:MAG: VWA domain-containing protein [Planctomycetes bacterium]|nr:VWA domain-containing protein [Planctomycetota bacterium]